MIENEKALEVLRRAGIFIGRATSKTESTETIYRAIIALDKQIPESPYPDGDKSILACSCCGSGEYLHNEDGNRNNYCGQCGKAILWEDEKPEKPWIYKDLDEAIDSD